MTVVYEDRDLLPHGLRPPAGYLEAVRAEIADAAECAVIAALADLPVGATVRVKRAGSGALLYVPDDDAAPWGDPTVVRDVLRRAALAITRALPDALAAASRTRLADCPVPAHSLLPGDWVTEVDTLHGPWYRVVRLDRDQRRVVVDDGTGHHVGVSVHTWDQWVLRRASRAALVP